MLTVIIPALNEEKTIASVIKIHGVSFVIGDHLLIDVRGKDCEVEVIKLPFVPSHVR